MPQEHARMNIFWKFRSLRPNKSAIAVLIFGGVLLVLVENLVVLWRVSTKPTKDGPFRTPSRTSFCPPFDVLRGDQVNWWGRYPLETRFLTIGLSTVHRKGGEYLVQTIQSLLDNMDDTSRQDSFLVVHVADSDPLTRYKTSHTLASRFRKYVDEGFLHVIQAYDEFYPQLANLKQKFGDSELRRKWRSKQNVDYAFLMCYCQYMSQFYLHIEDDTLASPKFAKKLREYVSKEDRKPWLSIDAASRGYVAKLYHSRDLGNMASYLLLMYDEMPIDWLMQYWVIIHGDELTYPATLFGHVGEFSTLSEKFVNVSDRYFDHYDHKYSGLNPEADITSSFVPYQGTPSDAYQHGLGYFWGKNVSTGDFVLIKFREATRITHIFVDTGSNLAKEDFLREGALQASFSKNGPASEEQGVCVLFEKLGAFNNGVASVSVTDERQIDCVRLLVTKSQETWVFLREIDIWQA